MAKKKTKKSNSSKKQFSLPFADDGVEMLPSINKGSVLRAFGIALLLVAVLHTFSMFGSAGYAGEYLRQSFYACFGFFSYILPILFVYIGVHAVIKKWPSIEPFTVFFLFLGILSFSGLLNTLDGFKELPGGLLGNIFGLPLYTLFSLYPTVLFLVLMSLYSVLSLFGFEKAIGLYGFLSDKFKKEPSFDESFVEQEEQKETWYKRLYFKFKSNKAAEEYYEEEFGYEPVEEPIKDIREHLLGVTNNGISKRQKTVKLEIEENTNFEEELPVRKQVQQVVKEKPSSVRSFNTSAFAAFVPPPLSLLQRDSGRASVGDTKANMNTIKRTLEDFGIQVEMDEVTVGPSVTRYALKPAQGVKLSRISGHRQELALALEAESVRIEAPIPGKALVGIEIPNRSKSMVGLASLLSHEAWSAHPSPLLVALGKGVSGAPVFSDLAKMPHVLIAGTTGSGKSVMVHSIINSLLFRNSPDMLKLIMVDPKKVEMSVYNNIPHLYTPVITSAKPAIRTLTWAVNEMERRYDVLEENGERDINAYHKNVYDKAVVKAKGDEDADLPEKMPYIVILIDELADIMMAFPKELESAIVRLAQKSRAVGIHLILSTQRPSVNVITGLIKANIPSRIALKVASQIDSRTIIDISGAEQLIGQGDLLFQSSQSPKLERVQSPFVSDNEVKNVVEYLKKHYRDTPRDEINVDTNPQGDKTMNALFGTDFGSIGGGDTDDDLFEQAREIVICSRKASTSYLQRRLKIGYSRAARLMDMLEERSIIGPGDGAKGREVLVEGEVVELIDSSDN